MNTLITNIASSIASTVIGGLLLAFIFFLLKERWLKTPTLVGNWIFEIFTDESDYKPYRNMILRYYVLLWQEGNTIKGTGEKIYEKTDSNERCYVGKDRSQVKITGYLTKKYFSKDAIIIHYEEIGEIRNSSTMHKLAYNNQDKLNGSFVSTIANQTGKATWTRRTN